MKNLPQENRSLQLKHDLVSPQERKRPGRIVKGSDWLSNDGKVMVVDVLHKCLKVRVDILVRIIAGETNDHDLLARNGKQPDFFVVRFGQGVKGIAIIDLCITD